MDIHSILEILPHRYPFLLVDRIVEFTPNERLIALKNVTINEPFFQGHFPGQPVMPGVLILEAMAQTSALLAFKSRQALAGGGPARKPNEVCYFAGIDDARFKRPVVPGDTLLIEAKMGKFKRSIWVSEVSATVNGELACSASLIAAIKEV